MKKKLYCSPDKKICGVCAGLADYFGIDPTIMRFIVGEIAFFTAILPAFIVYLIMAIVIPQAPADYTPGSPLDTLIKTIIRATREREALESWHDRNAREADVKPSGT